MVRGLKIEGNFKGLTQKTNRYRISINKLRDKTYNDVSWYGGKVANIMRMKSPEDTGRLKNAIKRLPLSKSRVKVRLEPLIPYWMYQEFGLKTPKWVSVQDKPDLQGWLKRHPQVKTRKFIGEDNEVVEVLRIGGTNTRLGRKNKFVKPAQDFINENHKNTILFTAAYFRKILPKDG